MAPPRARRFGFGHLGGLDDEALQVFLAPGGAGVTGRLLGTATQGDGDWFAGRARSALNPAGLAEFDLAHAATAAPDAVARAQREVVDALFWPLLYWHEPAAYEELVAGEHINPALLSAIEVSGRTVCDVGAGAGRFTLFAAATAARVIAVDAIPALLSRLRERLRDLGIENVDLRRGTFTALPVADGVVDIAVSCSAVTSHSPFGGDAALAEMERIVRPGGTLVVIWPDRPAWFEERGFARITAGGNHTLDFPDPATAERLCRDFYSEEAARWVTVHQAASVPFAVLGVQPPNEMCVRDLPG